MRLHKLLCPFLAKCGKSHNRTIPVAECGVHCTDRDTKQRNSMEEIHQFPRCLLSRFTPGISRKVWINGRIRNCCEGNIVATSITEQFIPFLYEFECSFVVRSC